MSEMVEKAAKAAYERFIEPVRDLEPTWDQLPQSHRDRLIDSQRAAIEAMRQPNLAMVIAAENYIGRHAYAAMISAALSEVEG